MKIKDLLKEDVRRLKEAPEQTIPTAIIPQQQQQQVQQPAQAQPWPPGHTFPAQSAAGQMPGFQGLGLGPERGGGWVDPQTGQQVSLPQQGGPATPPPAAGTSPSLTPTQSDDIPAIDPSTYQPGTVPVQPSTGESPDQMKQRRLAQHYSKMGYTPHMVNQLMQRSAGSSPQTGPSAWDPQPTQGTAAGQQVAPPAPQMPVQPGNFAMPGAQQPDPTNPGRPKAKEQVSMRDLAQQEAGDPNFWFAGQPQQRQPNPNPYDAQRDAHQQWLSQQNQRVPMSPEEQELARQMRAQQATDPRFRR